MQVLSLEAKLQSGVQQQAVEAATQRAAAAQQQLDAAVEEAARRHAEVAGLQRQLDHLQQQMADVKVTPAAPASIRLAVS